MPSFPFIPSTKQVKTTHVTGDAGTEGYSRGAYWAERHYLDPCQWRRRQKYLIAAFCPFGYFID